MLGALLAIPDPAVASILARSGFDFVVVDAEHAAFTLESMRSCVEAVQAAPAAAIVRIAGNDPVLIKQALDLGVDAVQVPNVYSAEEAVAAVRASRFAPEGVRGIGLGRASGYGSDMAGFLRDANARTAVIVMIEQAEGVADAEAIARVPGIDGIVVGPFDLSASLGVIGQPGHPLVVEAIDRILAGARAAGVACGTVCSAGEAPAQVARGMRLLTIFADGPALSAAARESVAAARST